MGESARVPGAGVGDRGTERRQEGKEGRKEDGKEVCRVGRREEVGR